MPDLVRDTATICVVNYRTLDVTRMCLRSIRKYTDYPYEVLVIDTDSRDESLDYLKGLSWIRLVERRPERPDPDGSYAHGAALDLGLSLCHTEFFVTLHSDTIILRPGWLSPLIGSFEPDPGVACVGGDRVERMPRWRILLKRALDVKALHRRLFADADRRLRYRPFIRTVYAAYRTEVLRGEALSFLPEAARGLTVGQKLYLDLRERGYRTVRLSDAVACQYVVHLAHATQVLNPREFGLERIAKKWHRALESWLASESFQALLQDDRLDH